LFCGLGGWAVVHAVIEHWERSAPDITAAPFRYMDSSSADPNDDDDRNA
jgi:hypothetical protein